MKKIILFAFLSGLLYAGGSSDVAFTTGYNKFDDPDYLRKGRFFFGIRGGVYQDNYGFQLGYERAKGANCQGLNLDRIYTNALLISDQKTGIKPYGLFSAGYEMSNIHEHKPSQLFMGVGAGVRAELTPKVNGFIETRILRKLKSDDTDIITTLGVAYALNNDISSIYTAPKKEVYNSIKTPKPVTNSVVLDSGYENKTSHIVTAAYVEPEIQQLNEQKTILGKRYYIQIVALAKTSPEPYLEKLYNIGFDNAQVKFSNIRGKDMSLVIVGPYDDRKQAARALRKLKKVSRGAFIRKF
jgi:hypothetical protein